MGNQRRRYPADKPYFRLIDWVFRHEREIRRAIDDERYRDKSPLIRSGNSLVKPTEREAMESMSPSPVKVVIIGGQYLYNPERWLEVIRRTYDFSRKMDWYECVRRYYDGQSYVKITMECHISQNVLFNLLNSAKTRATLLAVQEGLIHVD